MTDQIVNRTGFSDDVRAWMDGRPRSRYAARIRDIEEARLRGIPDHIISPIRTETLAEHADEVDQAREYDQNYLFRGRSLHESSEL